HRNLGGVEAEPLPAVGFEPLGVLGADQRQDSAEAGAALHLPYTGGVGPEAGAGDGEVGPAIRDRQVLGDRVEDGDTWNSLLEDHAQWRGRPGGEPGAGAGRQPDRPAARGR